MLEIIGFKDWAAVCTAMAQGRQSIIIRKGGIAEGRDGFQFKHPEFFLFPTAFHEQFDKLRPEEAGPLRSDVPGDQAEIVVRAAFQLEWAATVTDRVAAAALAPFHVYRDAVVRERFDYDDAPGVQVAFGRALRVDPAWSFPAEASFGGCRSWIRLPENAPDPAGLAWVLDDDAHAQRSGALSAWLREYHINPIRFQP